MPSPSSGRRRPRRGGQGVNGNMKSLFPMKPSPETQDIARPQRFFEDRFGMTSSLLERLLGSALVRRGGGAAPHRPRATAERAASDAVVAVKPDRRPHDLYSLAVTPVAADVSGKVALLRRIDEAARGADPRVRQVIASLSSEEQIILIATASGWTVGDVRPLPRLSVTVIAEQDGRREVGSYGGGGRVPFDFFLEEERWKRFAGTAVKQALLKLRAGEAPPGTLTVVLGPGWPGILLHEAVGHGLEGDFNRKKVSAFAGRIGEPVASPLVTVVDDGTLPNRRGSLNVDGEGHATG